MSAVGYYLPRHRYRDLQDAIMSSGRTYSGYESHYEGSGMPISHMGPTYWNFTYSPTSPRGRQLTDDELHPEWHRAQKGHSVAGDVGGSFFSQKKWVGAYSYEPVSLTGNSLVNNVRRTSYFTGPFYAIPPGSVQLPTVTLDSLSTLGTTAIARCKPTNRLVSLAVDLAELRSEGLPGLPGVVAWKDRTHLARAAGGEYLNKQFGWDPLVSDIRKLTDNIANAHTVLAQYERSSGQVVRRRYEFPIETSEVRVVEANSDGSCEPYGVDSSMIDPTKPSPQRVRTTRTYKRTWFSGAFTYHLPVGYHSHNRMMEAYARLNILAGIELTPEVVWNATPWTWAVDWFSNAGDVVSNISNMATDGLVLKWGYIMQHHVQTVTYTIEGIPRLKTKYVYPSPVFACVETKRREVATPFGFGLNWSGFSPRQLAIAVALGISRRRPL